MIPRTPAEQTERMRNLLAALLVGAFISMLPLFAFVVIPEANKDIIVYVAGQLSGMALLALGFYFVNKAGQDAIDAKRAETTQTALEGAREAVQAVQAANTATAGPDAAQAANQVADAATTEADRITKGD